eukprot:TRINITY_DN217_c0_g1_i1.p1 TRINITY_DN217_c0_g1~~TRINITY_DN217_c0_g1_i1.p1  ORF type:complete len:123 (+),score=16.20 TRINITY_DN217_c0_g1_i1:78-446(+)
MNLNYSSINPDQYSEDVKSSYAFPSKKQIEKFQKKEISGVSAEERRIARADSKIMALSIIGGFTIGTASYFYLRFPDGAIIRQRMDAQLPPIRRYTRRLIPFLGLAIPIYMVRNSDIFQSTR